MPRALLSVSNKRGIVEFAHGLTARGYEPRELLFDGSESMMEISLEKLETRNPAAGSSVSVAELAPETRDASERLQREAVEALLHGENNEAERMLLEAIQLTPSAGAAYNNLDYSFSAAHPDGTAPFTKSPGGGGPTLRRQLQILKQFIESFDFLHMAPDNAIIKNSPPGATARALAETGKQYAVYLKGGSSGNLTLAIPPGHYRAEWLNPRTGAIDTSDEVVHEGHSLTLASPAYSEDVALRLVRSGQ